jgi:hypothetical protein
MNTANKIETGIGARILHAKCRAQETVLQGRGVELGDGVSLGIRLPSQLVPPTIHKETDLSGFVGRSGGTFGDVKSLPGRGQQGFGIERIQFQDQSMVGKNLQFRKKTVRMPAGPGFSAANREAAAAR